MIYLKCKKNEFGNLIETKNDAIFIEIYDDMFYSKCPKCLKEQNLKLDEVITILEKDTDFSTTSYLCQKCSEIKED